VFDFISSPLTFKVKVLGKSNPQVIMGSKEEETAQSRQDEDVNLSSEKGRHVPVAIENTLIEAGGAPNPWGRGHIKLYLLCSLVYLCSTMNGRKQTLILRNTSRCSTLF
jgi:hypothetical protein